MSRKRKLGIAGLVGLLACVAAVGSVQVASDEVVPIPVQIDELKRTENQLSVELLMEAKLKEAEKILKGLVTHDFDQIAKSAESLKLMSLKPPHGWEKKTDDDEVYEHFRSEFMRQAARLEEEARNKHLAGAAYFQQNLTATCIACHDYIRDEDLKEE